MMDQEEKECLVPLPASLIVMLNTPRHQTLAVFFSLSNSLVKLLVLELAHFFYLFPITSPLVVGSSQFHHP